MKKLLFRPILTACLILVALVASASFELPDVISAQETRSEIKPFGSSGTTGLYIVQGSGAGRANGDFISSDDGLDTFFRYFIEVPPGLNQLQVDIFDADFGAGGGGEATAGRDRARNAFNSSVNYTLLDPSGTLRPTTFTTGNTTAPTGADNAWLTFYSGTGNNVQDNFGANAYNNNDGNNNWSGNWTESDGGGGGATGGAIRVINGELRLQDGVNGTPSIERQADLLGTPGLNLTAAYLSFDYRTSNNLEDSDQISVEVSGNGGGSWVTLETFSNDSNGSRTYDISAFIANNTRVRFLLVSNFTGTEFFFVDNVQIHDGGPITAGHWELRVDASTAVTTGDDINAFGIRAHDGNSGSGGTELNVYFDSSNGFGVNDGLAPRSYSMHPYVTSGCACSENDFDYDISSGATGSVNSTSRTGAFVNNLGSSSLSNNNVWRRTAISGWTSDTVASDYGIWSSSLTISTFPGNGNYTIFYMGNYLLGGSSNPATSPSANPVPNSFRVYLPTDSGAAPAKPYLEQFVTHLSGPNPPSNGQPSAFVVTVRMVNPTSQAITFSAANLITANIPGGGATYEGNAAVTQGSIVSQPAVGGTGNITWNPGTVAAGASVRLGYQVRVTPTSAGQRIPVTATPTSGNGTRAQYIDETGNTTQTRARYLFGPLCELAVTEGTLAPTEATLIDFEAIAYAEGVKLEWKTGYEINNLGFRLYREENGQRALVNKELIAGSALIAGAGTALTAGRAYSWADTGAASPDSALYWLEDIDLDGTVTVHGPFTVRAGAGRLKDVQLSSLLSQPSAGYSVQKQFIEPDSKAVSKPKKKPNLRLQGLNETISQSAVKFSIREEGWYRINISDLISAGLDPAFNPQFLQLFAGGEEQAVALDTKQGVIEFYGAGQDSLFTDARTYWVMIGQQPGKRIAQMDARSKSEGSGSFDYTVELKEKLIYFSALLNDDEDNFFGRIVASAPVSQNLTLSKLDSSFSGMARLELSLQGVTSSAGPTDHQVRVSLNGTEVGRVVFDGMIKHAETLFAPHSLLREGANTVTLVSEGGSLDVNLVDYIRLTYSHLYTADNDSLKFKTGSDAQTEIVLPISSTNPTIGGFSSPLIRVIDITNPATPQELIGNVTEQDQGFAVTVNVSSESRRVLMAFAEERIRSVASIQRDQPSNLRSRSNQADMVIITHRNFASGMSRLKDHRESQKMQVVIVDIEDIYDEFNFGDKNPQALKSFLLAAKTWAKPPRFVLLVGDATFDPRNYLGAGNFDFVPTKLIDTATMETASDDWLSDFNSDGIADMFIGRLPVRSVAAVDLVVSKIIDYETSFTLGKLTKKALVIADLNDGFNFEAASNEVQSQFPANYTIRQAFRSQSTDAATRTAVLEAINSGQTIVNYTGHGSTTVLRGLLLQSSDAPALSNRSNLSLFVMMTCMNGYFHDPTTTGLAEALVAGGNGGAIAAWASSALTDPGQQKLIVQQFYNLLFAAPDPKASKQSIGEIVAKAKIASSNLDVKRTWIFFGDPSMQLR